MWRIFVLKSINNHNTSTPLLILLHFLPPAIADLVILEIIQQHIEFIIFVVDCLSWSCFYFWFLAFFALESVWFLIAWHFLGQRLDWLYLELYWLDYLAYIWMIHHLCWINTLGWVPPQAVADKSQCIAWTVRNHCLQRDFWVLRNANASLRCLFKSIRPASAWRAQYWRDFADLIHFRVAEEERFAQVHLRDDAADCKYVNWGRICWKFEEKFRCTIPSSGDVFSIWRFAPDFPADTEIDDFDW